MTNSQKNSTTPTQESPTKKSDENYLSPLNVIAIGEFRAPTAEELRSVAVRQRALGNPKWAAILEAKADRMDSNSR